MFVGLDSWTGLGTFSLALPTVPPAVNPTVATMAWALVIGVIGALLGWVIRWLGLVLRPVVHLNRVLVTIGFGALVGLGAMTYQLVSGHSFTEVLFSGQDALPELVAHAADYSVGALVLLAACKMLAYGLSLSAFRGGPVFPAMFVGATVGIALSGLPGLSLAPAIAAGIGAHVCGDAAAAADVGAAGHPPARQGRHRGDAPGRGRGRGGVRRDHGAPGSARGVAGSRRAQDSRACESPDLREAGAFVGCLRQMRRLEVFRPVRVEAIMTRTAATMIATIQRTQSTPALPLPPNAA